MRLAAIEKAEKTLFESHKFYPIWFKYSFTVIPQSTIKFDDLVLSPPSTLIAYSFKTKKEIEERGWRHLKKLKKYFQNRMNFTQFG